MQVHCKHNKLVLLPENIERLRCRHCHLTIKSGELHNGYCPECFANNGKKRYDFEKISTSEVTRYRCEECGVIIGYSPRGS